MKVLFALLIFAFSTAAFATHPVADSGASGDKRRTLTAGLERMGAVDVPAKYSGAYIGLYDVECEYADSYPLACKAAKTPGGVQMSYDSDAGAVLVGSVLKANVDGAENAVIIKAGKVACNTVGDECVIEKVSVRLPGDAS